MLDSAERTSLKVTSVYRRRFVIQVEKIEKERNNGQSVKLVSFFFEWLVMSVF